MRIEHFTASGEQKLEKWVRAFMLGFNCEAPTKQQIENQSAQSRDNDMRMTQIIESTQNPDPAMAETPVGTYAWFPGTVNMGAGPTEAGMITIVTVRPTHKRRGYLRTMMTAGLEDMAASGKKMAALTASSAAIYGRFGFADVVGLRQITVSMPQRFVLNVDPGGHVEAVTMPWLFEQIPAIFDQFHEKTRGSANRYVGFYQNEEILKKDGTLDLKYHGAVHLDQNGTVDGYVVYWFKETVLHVADWVSLNDHAELGLWSFLASIENVKEITCEKFPIDSVLPLALVDSRVIETQGTIDGLWTRVLDASVLEQRPYQVENTILTFNVTDPMGFAEGTYRLSVTDSQATIEPVAEEATTTIHVTALASLAFGAQSASTLASVGLIQASSVQLQQMDAVFVPIGMARFASPF